MLRTPGRFDATSGAADLRALRAARGWSQSVLASLLGVSRQQVSAWELGDGWPSHFQTVLLGAFAAASPEASAAAAELIREGQLAHALGRLLPR